MSLQSVGPETFQVLEAALAKEESTPGRKLVARTVRASSTHATPGRACFSSPFDLSRLSHNRNKHYCTKQDQEAIASVASSCAACNACAHLLLSFVWFYDHIPLQRNLVRAATRPSPSACW